MTSTMEDCKENAGGNNSNKRPRDDFETYEVDSPESKHSRVEQVSSEPESDVASPEAKRIQEDLLNILDDPDLGFDRDPEIPDLDSVIKSFEEEILVPPPVPDMTSDSGESRSDLGYLLEASDDELGLPPTFSSGDEQKEDAVNLEPGVAAGFDGMLGFEDNILSYDSFELGIGGNTEGNSNGRFNSDNGADFVTLGGLFDYSDDAYDPADLIELTWQPESLPAL